jgi:DNA-binding IclR family transcriptional regulator
MPAHRQTVIEDVSPVKTVDRLVQVLDCFSLEQPTWTLAELSTHLAVPKSTLHRFLSGLETHGILRRDPIDKRWRLGYRLFVWGNLAAESTGLRHIAGPIMRDLMDATHETAILTVYHDYEVICIDTVETSQPVRLTLNVGTRRYAHAGASSKVLTAYLPDEEIQAIIRDKGLPRLCTNTITDPDDLMADLARIRKQGYAVSREETDVSAWGVAAPIFGWDSDVVVAAIGIAGPTSRFNNELVKRYAAQCKQSAEQVSELLRQRT